LTDDEETETKALPLALVSPNGRPAERLSSTKTLSLYYLVAKEALVVMSWLAQTAKDNLVVE